MTPRLLALACVLAVAALPAAADEPAPSRFEVSGPATERIAVIEAPAVTAESYAVAGTVAYDGVEGAGYLEMWSVFPDGSRYFSRTLDGQGPLAALSGSSRPRPFALPFFLAPGDPRPVRLEVNVVLPAGGRATVSDLRFASPAEAAIAAGAWWSPETAGWIGGVAGSALGLFGALLGALGSLGRGRSFVLAGLRALGVSGVVSLAVGGAALALRQPYAVWYPLLLIGGLCAALGLALPSAARRRFAARALPGGPTG